jgi:hypothetical protein
MFWRGKLHHSSFSFPLPQGVAEVLPWNLPLESAVEIRTENIFAALNDCVYRNMGRHKYLALIDVDELIVPHQQGAANLLATLALVEGNNRAASSVQAGRFIAAPNLDLCRCDNGTINVE